MIPIPPACLAAIHGPDIAAINRCINGAVPFRGPSGLPDSPLMAWSDEGRDGYDCKGFGLIKARALHSRGIPDSAMRVLIVDNGTKTTNHLVLQVGAVVLDNSTPWLQRPGDYRILATFSVTEAFGEEP